MQKLQGIYSKTLDFSVFCPWLTQKILNDEFQVPKMQVYSWNAQAWHQPMAHFLNCYGGMLQCWARPQWHYRYTHDDWLHHLTHHTLICISLLSIGSSPICFRSASPITNHWSSTFHPGCIMTSSLYYKCLVGKYLLNFSVSSMAGKDDKMLSMDDSHSKCRSE